MLHDDHYDNQIMIINNYNVNVKIINITLNLILKYQYEYVELEVDKPMQLHSECKNYV